MRPVVDDADLTVVAFYGDGNAWMPCASVTNVASPWDPRPTPQTADACTLVSAQDGDGAYRRTFVWRLALDASGTTTTLVRGHLTLRERPGDRLALVLVGHYGPPSAPSDLTDEELNRRVIDAAGRLLDEAVERLSQAGQRILDQMLDHPTGTGDRPASGG